MKISRSLASLSVFTVLSGAAALPAQADPVVAQYFVPPSANLPQGMTYAIPGSALNIRADGVVLAMSLVLPQDLFGPNFSLMLTNVNPIAGSVQAAFQTNGATAECKMTSTLLECLMTYVGWGLEWISQNDLSSFITQKYGANPALLAQKQAESLLFRADPEGIVMIPLR